MPRHAWTLVPTHTVARAPAHRACRYDIGEPTAARLSVHCSCNVCLLPIMPAPAATICLTISASPLPRVFGAAPQRHRSPRRPATS